MRAFGKMSIGTRITSGFFSIAVLLVVVGYVGITGMIRIDREMMSIYDENVVTVIHLKNASEALNHNLTSLRNALLHRIHGSGDAYLDSRAEFDNSRARFHEQFDAYRAAHPAAEEQAKAAHLAALMEEFERRQDLVMNLLEGNDTRLAYQKVFDNIGIIGSIHTVLAEMNALEQRGMDAAVAKGKAAFKDARNTMVAFALLGAITALLMGYLISRMISTPVNDLVRVADNISRGELDDAITVTRYDEIGQLQRSMQAMSASLNRMASAATAIADGDLEVKIAPQSERDVLGNALAGMLNELTRTISIAYETNLLALNMAIERSRNETPNHDLNEVSGTQVSNASCDGHINHSDSDNVVCKRPAATGLAEEPMHVDIWRTASGNKGFKPF